MLMVMELSPSLLCVRQQTPEDCDPVLRGLVEKCFASAPHDRPDFHEIFATLDNYHKCLVENDARALLLLDGGSMTGKMLMGCVSNSLL